MTDARVLVRPDPNQDETSRVPVAKVVVTQWSDGAMSVAAPMSDPAWVVAALEHALDAAKRQLARVVSRPGFVIPAEDVSL